MKITITIAIGRDILGYFNWEVDNEAFLAEVKREIQYQYPADIVRVTLEPVSSCEVRGEQDNANKAEMIEICKEIQDRVGLRRSEWRYTPTPA
jgi:hypothetical protein